MKFGVKKPIKILNSMPLPPDPPFSKLSITHNFYWTRGGGMILSQFFTEENVLAIPYAVIASRP
jgi:hypothetical protein